MFENVDGYYGIFIARVKSKFVYKQDWLMWVLLRFAAAFVMILVFTAIYLGTNTTSIKGFRLTFLYAYFFLENAVWYGLPTDMKGQMQEDIQNGTVAAALVKPVSYIGRLISGALAETSMALLFIFMPLFVVGLLLSGITISMQTALVFVAEMALAYGLSLAFDFLVGTSAIYLVEVWAVATIYWSIAGLINGSVMPLSFFPQWLQNVMLLTPFPAMAYAQVSTLIGTVSSQYIIESMISGAVWLVVLVGIAYLWWGKVRKNITSAGG